uniref:Nsp1_C domain-containing protein n=1 Tax=Caenorhabditis tropicalis TaxID=1561998 RepID=A0A1I7UST6_9PELO
MISLFEATTPAATNASTVPLFGSTTTASTSGGLFGSKPATTTAPSGGLFGATTTTTASPATGGLFGAKTAAATPPAGGLFGSSTAAPSGGLFGAKPTTTSAPTIIRINSTSASTAQTTSATPFAAPPATTNTVGLGGVQQQASSGSTNTGTVTTSLTGTTEKDAAKDGEWQQVATLIRDVMIGDRLKKILHLGERIQVYDLEMRALQDRVNFLRTRFEKLLKGEPSLTMEELDEYFKRCDTTVSNANYHKVNFLLNRFEKLLKAPAATGGLFGSKPAAAAPPAGGLFGSSTTTAAPSTGLVEDYSDQQHICQHSTDHICICHPEVCSELRQLPLHHQQLVDYSVPRQQQLLPQLEVSSGLQQLQQLLLPVFEIAKKSV